jgi:hypothetical protein
MRGFVVAALVSIVPAHALADGETTPMVGAAVLWSPSDQDPSGMAGLELEAAWWHGRIGLALEGTGRAFVDGNHPRAATLGASLRLRVFDGMTPSLMEPRDSEVGIELQGIIERFWWEGHGADDPDVGFGLAVRVRGGGDDGSTRLAESRFFLRVMATPAAPSSAVARMTTTTTTLPSDTRQLAVIFGIGASFGGGERHYMDRFRWHSPDWAVTGHYTR